jgi:ABC transport system ATP-binding/permease protein
MALLTLTNAELAYGDLPLLDRASFALEEREKIGLIGRNGTGKSSLLGVLAGQVALDDGELKTRDGLRIVLVPQEPEFGDGARTSAGSDQWQFGLRPRIPPPAHKLAEYRERLGVDANLDPARASGGERKRAALAAAFAQEPDVLLLDEPTNHLDIDGIVALEALLLRQSAAIFVTHDRAFLDRVASRILELDRGRLLSFPGNYAAYEKRKSEQLAIEAVVHAKFDKFWAQEEAWIRKGIEARRTRNEGRVRRLEQLREERAARRVRGQSPNFASSWLGSDPEVRSGRLVAELAGVSKSYGERPLVKDLDLIISRGDRIGLIGPNGAGKTTLLNLILGNVPPDAGSVRLGANVQPAYFDQLRAALDPRATVADTISPGSEWIEAPGGRKHVMSYLGEFLFPPRRANAKVAMLSGGERNRLLLARLFARPANVLVLDEPTNDLDIESLELLEAALQDYSGTLLLVSHDRAFLDNVVTQTLAAQGDGTWKEYAGGYSDYVQQRGAGAVVYGERAILNEAEARRQRKPSAKLTYKETRELESLPREIEALEAEQRALYARMHAPDYYREPPQVLRADRARTDEIERLLMEKLERWEALEAKTRP